MLVFFEDDLFASKFGYIYIYREREKEKEHLFSSFLAQKKAILAKPGGMSEESLFVMPLLAKQIILASK